MKLVMFICNWCYNMVADIEEVAGVKAIRVMCSGRIAPGLIFKAFELGADAVLVVGCPQGECHYVTGNEQAEKNIELAKGVLELLGISPQRIRFERLPYKEQWKINELISGFRV